MNASQQQPGAPRLPSSCTSRPFSTEARVHPNIQPYLHNTRKPALKWLAPAAALVAAGYMANNYRETALANQAAQTAETEKQAHESRELAAKLLDAYGDGGSVEDLERAVAVYENETAGKEVR